MRKPNPQWKTAIMRHVFNWLCFAHTQGLYPWWKAVCNRSTPPLSYTRAAGWRKAVEIVTLAFAQTSITSIPPCGVETKLWEIYHGLVANADEVGTEPAYVEWARGPWRYSQYNVRSSTPDRHFDAAPYALSLAAHGILRVIQDYVCKHKWGPSYCTSEYGIIYTFHKCHTCKLEVEMKQENVS